MRRKLLWKFDTAQYRVALWAEPEDIDPKGCFEFPEDVAFASDGEPAHWFCAVVTVTHRKTKVELGRDLLGGCSYSSFEEFYTSHRDNDPMNRNCTIMRAKHGNCTICHYFPSMVSEAIRCARLAAKPYAGLKAA